MPNTIADVEQLGYTIGIAQGSVQAEQDALEQARGDASTEVIGAQVATVTTETLGKLADAGRLPDSPDERRQLATDIAAAALDQLSATASDRISFHERAVEIAEGMPDVWVITGPGVTNVYVACKLDGTGWDEDQQAMLDALADPEAHRERVKQQKAAGTG